jgi:hypothetical protein
VRIIRLFPAVTKFKGRRAPLREGTDACSPMQRVLYAPSLLSPDRVKPFSRIFCILAGNIFILQYFCYTVNYLFQTGKASALFVREMITAQPLFISMLKKLK